ncbi:MAG: triple tyrosine motif-containing protein, partial [Bacteroidota bacterium]
FSKTFLCTFSNEEFFRSNLIDHKGRIWLGGNYGIYLIDIEVSRFKNYLSDQQLGRQNNHAIRGLTNFKNSILINGEFSTTYQLEGDTVFQLLLPEQRELKKNIAIAAYKDQEVWIGNSKRLNIYDLDWQVKKEIPMEGTPWSFYFDKNETAFIGTNKGIYQYDLETEQIKKYTPPLDLAKINQTFVYHFTKDHLDNLWIATGNGLYKMNPEQTDLVRYASDLTAPYYIPAQDIQHIHIDDENTFWLATRGNGLIKFDPYNNKIKQFTRSAGLSHNVIYAVYEDEKNYLWLPSDYGLIRFEKATGKSWTYTTKDGLINNEFNRVSHLKTKDGRIFLGTINGISVFHPTNFWSTENKIASPLVLTNYQRYNSIDEALEDLTTELLQTKTIVLNPSNDFCTLTFALLEYSATDKLNYAYKIDGFLDEWTDLTEGKLRLSNLPYGNYILSIKGQAADGQWSDQLIELQLKVIVPIYQRGWFITLGLLLLILTLSIVLIVYSSVQKARQLKLEKIIQQRTEEIRKDKQIIEKQAEELKVLDEAKNRFFNNISHELRTPLTLIIEPLRQFIKGNAGIKNIKDLYIPLNNSQKLLELVNQLLDLSKLESNKMDLQLQRNDIEEQMASITDSFQLLAQSQNIKLNFSSIRPIPLAFWDVNKMEKIAYNLLSNALKFTKAGGQIDYILN